jgi:hypothetical protein
MNFFSVSVMPLQVSIQGRVEPLSANQTARVRCLSWGSRPPARLSWWLGADRLPDSLSKVSL